MLIIIRWFSAFNRNVMTTLNKKWEHKPFLQQNIKKILNRKKIKSAPAFSCSDEQKCEVGYHRPPFEWDKKLLYIFLNPPHEAKKQELTLNIMHVIRQPTFKEMQCVKHRSGFSNMFGHSSFFRLAD